MPKPKKRPLLSPKRRFKLKLQRQKKSLEPRSGLELCQNVSSKTEDILTFKSHLRAALNPSLNDHMRLLMSHTD